ncbi:MAG: NAD-dependent succinate-semialdehyde dehydrogenase [Leucobacter sp.]
MRTSKQLINGAWVDSSDGDTLAVVNPANGETLGSIPAATPEDLNRALTASSDAWQGWRRLGGWKRSAILRKTAEILTDRAEEIAQRLTAEQGKPISEARLEVAGSIEQFDWYADEARRVYGRIPEARDTLLRYSVHREPVGPVAAFTPWNFPLLLAVRKVAPALAAGCTMILKPASEAPGPVLLMAEALIEAGLPSGVLQVVTGQAAQISEKLLSSPIIRKFSFTGSVPVGQHLIKLGSANIVNVSMELGGHAPVVIMGDVDPAAIGRQCAQGKFRNAGQVCISPTRFIVHESIADEFAAAFSAATAEIKVGDGADEHTEMGPLISDGARGRVQSLIDDALANGAQLTHGGGNLPGEGFYFAPTVLVDVPREAAIMQEEPFGPIAPVTRFSTRDEAIELANATPFGLAAYVFTTNLDDFTVLSEEIQAGIVGVNTFAVSSASVPFGGVKHSGIGAENGTEAMEAYLVSKTVAVSPFSR